MEHQKYLEVEGFGSLHLVSSERIALAMLEAKSGKEGEGDTNDE